MTAAASSPTSARSRNQHYGCTFTDLGAMRWMPRLGSDNTLMTFAAGRAQLTETFDQLQAAAERERPGLIITDTLADIFGGSEIDRVQVRAFVQIALGGLARRTGASVIGLAHPSLSGINTGTGSSGSTSWVGTFRSHLFLARPPKTNGAEPDQDARTLTRKKANYARRDETLDLRWRNGVFVNAGPLPGILGSIERRNCEQVFLRLLDRTLAQSRLVSDRPRAPNYAPKRFATQPDREGYAVADFAHAMERLFTARRIRNETRKGSDRKPYECVVPVNEQNERDGVTIGGAGGAGGCV